MIKPHFVIGDPLSPYLLRWHLIPRNRWFNIYLHHILRDDPDRGLHDHPFNNMSIVLGKYGYLEYTSSPGQQGYPYIRFQYDIVFRKAAQPHRLALQRDHEGNPIPCWSLFITGPRIREWGFYTKEGWLPWYEVVDPENRGQLK